MKKSKKNLLAVLGVLLLALVAGGVFIGMKIVPAAGYGLHVSELLQPVMNAENQTMRISVSARVNDQPLSLDSDVYLVTEGNIRYLALEQDGMVLYIADNILLLENGKAFKHGQKMQAQTVSCKDLLPQIGALYDVLRITAEETETETVYAVAVTGEQVQTLLAAASLGEALPAECIRQVDLRLTEKNGKLEQIRFAGSGEGNGTAVSLDVTVSGFRVLASGDYPIPEAVRHTAETADPESLFSLTEDLFRLVAALAPLEDPESIDGSLELRVDCGPVQLDTEMNLSDLKTSASGQIDPEQLKALPEMIGLLCMEGDISCTREGDAYVYALELDEDAMRQLSRMILPELASYGGDLTEGTVTVLLEGGAIVALDVSIGGSIRALITRIPVEVGAVFTFE